MFGAKGPGGRGVYARRRLVAVVVVLIVLALLAPRACQALLGSNEDAGQGEGQRSGTAGKVAGTGAQDDAGDAGPGNADTGNAGAEKSGAQDKPVTQDDSSNRGAPFVEDEPGTENGSGEASEEATPDLGVLATNLAVIDGSEDFAASEDQGGGGSAPGSQEPVSEQPISEVQFALAASPAPTQQPSSEPEPAPTRRSEPAAAAPVAAPAPIPLGERIRDRAGRRARVALAEPAALDEVAARQIVVEPVAVEPVAPAPVAVEPVAPAPVAVEPVAPAPIAVEPVAPAPPAAIPSHPAFAPTPATGALNGAPTVPAARTTLPAGPRLARVGPGRTPGPTVF